MLALAVVAKSWSIEAFLFFCLKMEKSLERLQLAIEKTGLSLALGQDDLVADRLNEIMEILEKGFPQTEKLLIPQNMIE